MTRGAAHAGRSRRAPWAARSGEAAVVRPAQGRPERRCSACRAHERPGSRASSTADRPARPRPPAQPPPRHPCHRAPPWCPSWPRPPCTGREWRTAGQPTVACVQRAPALPRYPAGWPGSGRATHAAPQASPRPGSRRCQPPLASLDDDGRARRQGWHPRSDQRRGPSARAHRGGAPTAAGRGGDHQGGERARATPEGIGRTEEAAVERWRRRRQVATHRPSLPLH
mmetsp:Transcript_10496/g.33235  ORF Transcript_10496/g.33235 Transcript_10496/m.33235 type:complete len:226 (+) Transcript_10496:1547-2224(+)